MSFDLKGHFNRLFNVFCACSVLIISGCVSSEDLGRVKWELNQLKTEVNEISEKSQSIETRMPGQQKALQKQIQELEEKQKATAGTVSDLLIKIQELTSEFQLLTGRFEEARYFSEKNTAELMESRDNIKAKLKELDLELKELQKTLTEQEEERKKARAAKPAPAERADADGAAEGAVNTAVKDVYMEGYQALKDGSTATAREKFLSVLNDFSENEYSDNARFWIGESYYRESNYEDAILAYEELFRKNPDSSKVPGAMFKQGLAFFSLKDEKTGKLILEKLIEKYPESEPARLAKRKLHRTVPPKKN